MATEEQKKRNQVRLANMALLSVAAGSWDILGKGVNAFGLKMGDEILAVMEKEMGLEIAGEDPETILTELSRIFVDEYGFASDIDVAVQENGTFTLKVHHCVNRNLTDKLMAAGVEKPFICPVMNAARSALRRLGYKVHEDIEQWREEKGSVITLTSV